MTAWWFLQSIWRFSKDPCHFGTSLFSPSFLRGSKINDSNGQWKTLALPEKNLPLIPPPNPSHQLGHSPGHHSQRWQSSQTDRLRKVRFPAVLVVVSIPNAMGRLQQYLFLDLAKMFLGIKKHRKIIRNIWMVWDWEGNKKWQGPPMEITFFAQGMENLRFVRWPHKFSEINDYPYQQLLKMHHGPRRGHYITTPSNALLREIH